MAEKRHLVSTPAGVSSNEVTSSCTSLSMPPRLDTLRRKRSVPLKPAKGSANLGAEGGGGGACARERQVGRRWGRHALLWHWHWRASGEKALSPGVWRVGQQLTDAADKVLQCKEVRETRRRAGEGRSVAASGRRSAWTGSAPAAASLRSSSRLQVPPPTVT